MPKVVGLSPRQQAFVNEYLVDKSATQAALRAGFGKKSAARYGSELLSLPHIKRALAKALKEQQERTLITADKVLIDIQNFGDKAAKRGEYHAAIRSRELLGKHYKLFTEKHEHGGIGGGAVLLQITDKEAEL